MVEHVLGRDEVTGSKPVGGFGLTGKIKNSCVKLSISSVQFVIESIIPALRTRRKSRNVLRSASTVLSTESTHLTKR